MPVSSGCSKLFILNMDFYAADVPMSMQTKKSVIDVGKMVKYVSYAPILILCISKIELLTPNRLRDQHWIIDDSVCKKVKYAVS